MPVVPGSGAVGTGALLPGLDRDDVEVRRPGTAVDAEGIPTNVLTLVLTTVGTWGTPSYRDLERASQSGQAVDAIVAMATADVRVGDRVTVRDKTYTVTTVADARFHMRVGLRRTE